MTSWRDSVDQVYPDLIRYLQSLFPEETRKSTFRSIRGGIYTERQVRDLLQERDWTVIRAAGSKGPFDLVAVRAGWPVLGIQVKRGLTKWTTPVAASFSFYPVLIRRLAGGWRVERPEVTAIPPPTSDRSSPTGTT